MKIRYIYTGLLLVVILFTQHVYASDVTIYSNGSNSSTTTIRSKDATMANRTTMFVANVSGSGTSGYAEYRSLLRFNTLLSEMSGVTSVESAVLRLYCSSRTQETTLHIDSVSNSWTPTGATWSANSSYHDYDVSQLITSQAQFYEFDVTEIVNDWLGGTYTNNGFMLHHDYLGTNNYSIYYSPLYQPGVSAYDEYRPTLIIQETLATPVPEPLTIVLLGFVSVLSLLRRKFKWFIAN